MTKKHIRHIRHQAKKHEAAHTHLKKLLRRNLHVENVRSLFIATFLITMVSLIIFFNWGNIISLFTKPQNLNYETEVEKPIRDVKGFKSGILSNVQVNRGVMEQYVKYLKQIPAEGHLKGLKALDIMSKKNEEKAEQSEDIFLKSISLTTSVSKGAHLRPMSGAKGLQKSIMATFYLGEKTVNIDSAIQSDAQLLGKINNALSVDIFQFLNQSLDRADALDNFLNLLIILKNKGAERSQELGSVMSFLSGNFKSQETVVNLSEDTFFTNLKMFQGENAEEELKTFINLQQGQSEIRAKMGAYQALKGYYDFFLPKLDNLIRAIQANRDPLIAGVKVVEIQNMTLPLIIKEK